MLKSMGNHGVMDFGRLDTTPGATGPHAMFAPIDGYEGSGKDYLHDLRKDHDANPGVRTYLGTAAEIASRKEVVIEGPYAEELRKVLAKIGG